MRAARRLVSATMDASKATAIVSEAARNRLKTSVHNALIKRMDLAKLTEVVDELEAEGAARKPFIPDPHTWSALTYRFHELILEGCGNKTMAVQGAVLQDIVATHLRTKIAQRDDNDTDERFQRVIRSYTKLISLVKAGNAAGAEKHWRSHMEGAATYLLKDDLKTKPVVDLFE